MLVPLAANALLGVKEVYFAQFIALLLAKKAPALASATGIPGFWGIVAVMAFSLVVFSTLSAKRYWKRSSWGFLKTAAAEEWKRLKGALVAAACAFKCYNPSTADLGQLAQR